MDRARYNFAQASPEAAGRVAAAKAGIVANSVTELGKGIVEYGEMHDEGLAHKLQAAESNYELGRKKRDAENPYRLIREDGTPDKDAIDEEKRIYRDALTEAYGGGFWAPANNGKYRESVKNGEKKLEDTLAIQQVGQVSQFCTDSLKLNMGLAEQTGNWGRAHELLNYAKINKFISEPKFTKEEYLLGQRELLSRAQVSYDDNPLAFAASFDAGDYDGLSLDNKAKLKSLYRQAMNSAPRSAKMGKGADGKSTLIKPAPHAITKDMADLWGQFNGEFPDDVRVTRVNPLLENHVRYMMMRDPAKSGDANLQEEIRTLVKSFGGDEGYANGLIEQVGKEMFQKDTFNPSSILDTFDYEQAIGPASRQWLAHFRDEVERYKGVSVMQDDDERELRVLATRKVREYEEYAARIKKQIQADVTRKYDLWKNQNPDASYVEQTSAFLDLFEDATTYYQAEGTAWARGLEDEAAAIQKDRESFDIQAQEKAIEYGQSIIPDEAQATNIEGESVSLQLNVGRDYSKLAKREDYQTEPVLYVPKGSLNAQELDLYNGKNYTRAKVVETDDVSAPTTSVYLRARLGDGEGQSRGLKIEGGEGYFTVEPQAATSSTSDASAASLIFKSEARLDQDGKITVYRLPAADGGGSYEVAGINEASHPKQAAKLKALVEAGRHDEARAEAERYIAEYTAPAKKMLNDAGMSGAGAEYFLRDVYMNGGPGGAAAVLKRAKAKGGDPLKALAQARLEWYDAIIKRKPEKAMFRKGWVSRTKKTYNNALAINK
ncbi:MAG: hypothetical protein R3Y56_02605 [Akkermansia sp.]